MYFLNINKPKGITSFDVIKKLRQRLKIKQIGHSGTLDPLASGVLQIAVGDCTKLLDYLESDKTYIADIIFGYSSTTFDDEGEKTFINLPSFTQDDLINTLKHFIGKTMQTPPIYSAIKINGQKACNLARKLAKSDKNNNANNCCAIKAREIEIYSIELLEFSKDSTKAKIQVHCKKGTYIRSLVDDIGKKLKCGAYLSELTRTKAGSFELKDSNCIDDENYREIKPLECIGLRKYCLNEEELIKIRNGNFIQNSNFKENEYIILTKDNKLVSLAKISDNLIKPKKNFKEN